MQIGKAPEWMDDRNISYFKFLEGDNILESEEETEGQDLSLVSPKVALDGMGIFASTPTLSFDDSIDGLNELMEVEETSSNTWSASFGAIRNRFQSLKTKWASTFTEVEASHHVVVKDLIRLQEVTNSLRNMVGQPTIATLKNKSNLWTYVTESNDLIRARFQSFTESLSSISNNIDGMQRSQDAIRPTCQDLGEEQEVLRLTYDDRIQTMEKCLHAHEQRFTKILPLLLAVKSSPLGTHTKLQEDSALVKQVQSISSRLDALQETLWTSELSTQPSNGMVPLETIREIQTQLTLLHQRILGGGVQIGAKVFPSFDDVQVWVKTELPNRRYGLFVDAVSLLDFFTCIGHVDAEKTFAAFHSQQKTGFASMYEARVAASVQNLFPMVFGKSSASGLDDSEFLPAIQDPDKWDNGATGIRHQIGRGMTDVEYQLESAIDTVLGAYPEA